jgi:hypothetical protein
VARAKKVKCPACGAKNAAEDRRCRVCTAVINPDVPSAAPAAPTADEEAARAAADASASAAIQIPGEGGARSAFSGDGSSSKLSAALDGRDDMPDLPTAGAGQSPVMSAPDTPIYDEEFVPIEIDEAAAPRPGGPPPPVSDEHFDPNALEIDRAARPADDVPPPPEPSSSEHFDLGGLVVDEPTDPRPTD